MDQKEKKKKNADETLNIVKKIIDCNKDAQKNFQFASKVDRGKSEPKTEESIAERTTLRREGIAEVKRKEENINNLIFKYYLSKYQNPSDMYKKLCEKKGKKKMKIKYI